MTREIMLDLETMDNTPTSAVIAIGAVLLDTDAPADAAGFPQYVQSRFYTQINLADAVRAGLTMSAGTVMWWLKQSDEARAAFKDNASANSLHTALLEFKEWVANQGEFDRLWGNGVDFDNVILANAYRVDNQDRPWAYWQNACYRTLKGLFPDVPFVRQGVYHNALADAESQGLHLVKLLQRVHDGREKTQLS